jgi:NADH dehydrogenase (ubiquinone) 1 alpha/beta subcomplex 1
MTHKFRVYADDRVVHEDDYEEQDNAQTCHDDYAEHILPDCLVDFICGLSELGTGATNTKAEPTMGFEELTAPRAKAYPSTAPTLDEVTQRVHSSVKLWADLSVVVEDHMRFTGSELGLDSLDCIELLMSLEEEFDIEADDTQASNCKTVLDAINLVMELTR